MNDLKNKSSYLEKAHDRFCSDDFKSLPNMKSVRRFLNERGRNHHNGYFQYTNLTAAHGMMKSGMLHFSLGSSMNDLSEPLKTISDEWSRTYIACFAFGKLENIAMWTIYGHPFHDAIRIGFRHSEVTDAVTYIGNRKYPIYEVVENDASGHKTYDYKSLNIEHPNISIHDVVYSTGSSFVWNDRKLTSTICPDIKQSIYDEQMQHTLRGYIKNFAWKYEHETRIVITLPDAIDPHPKQIAIPFSRAIEKATYTLGPCTDNSRARTFGIPASSPSHFRGLVRMKSACSNCDFSDTPQCPIFNRQLELHREDR